MEPILDPPATTGRVRAPAPAPPEGSAGRGRALSLARRWRGMLVAATVTAGLVGYLVASSGTPTYETSSMLLVGPINTDLDTLRAAGQLAETYAQLATSRPVIDATQRRLRLRDISGSISADASEVTRLLTIHVRDRDPRRGAAIANAHARELLALAAARRGPRVPGGPGALQIVDPARPASSPSGPGAVPIAIVCALAGLLGALGLALLLDRSGETVRGAEDVTRFTGAGVVGRLGRGAWRAPGTPALVTRAPRSAGADEYRLLATRLRAIGERSLAVLRVDDRATGVAANLAAAMADGGTRVALLDLERDRATLLAPGAAAEPLAPTPGAALVADDARAVLHELGDADVVLVDAPSLQRSSGGLVWASVVDGTLIAAQIDRTARQDLAGTADSLRLVHARVLGTVLGAAPGMVPHPPRRAAAAEPAAG
jgi:capsular polysaccharide biosynthesis protein